MKATRVSIECDGCRRESDVQVNVTVEEVRTQIAADGWLANLVRDFDLCPDCTTERVGANVPRRLL